MNYFIRRHLPIVFSTLLAAINATVSLAASGSGAAAFSQLGSELPPGNTYRTASGAPGHQYWQQRANYKIEAELHEDRRRITASGEVRYTNNSPDSLRYLWLQLDQNRFRSDSMDLRSETVAEDQVTYDTLRAYQARSDTSFGYDHLQFADAEGQPLPFTVVDTMARLDLPRALAPGESINFRIDWAFNIRDQAAIGGRGGFEYFEDSDTQLFLWRNGFRV